MAFRTPADIGEPPRQPDGPAVLRGYGCGFDRGHRPSDTSPRPDEPDLHLRFSYGAVVVDYIACRTAAENLLRYWDKSHNPAVALDLVADGLVTATRLPCEISWLTR